jgi:integrase
MNEFNDWLKVNGRAKNTRRGYCQRIEDFLKFVGDDISKETIERFLLSLQDKRANKTINCYRNAISAYLKFKKLEVEVPDKLKEPFKIPDAITIEQFEKQVIPVVKKSFKIPEKVCAIFYLLFYSGLRPSELVALKRRDIDLQNLQGKAFRQKTNGDDIFMFPEKVRDIMKIYFIIEPEEKNAFNVSTKGVRRMTRKIKEHFPDFNLRPYLFRHSSATRLLNEGFSLLDIQNFLGHSQLQSTQKYLYTNKDELKKKYLKKIT